MWNSARVTSRDTGFRSDIASADDDLCGAATELENRELPAVLSRDVESYVSTNYPSEDRQTHPNLCDYVSRFNVREYEQGAKKQVDYAEDKV